jgi:hypothetical protein
MKHDGLIYVPDLKTPFGESRLWKGQCAAYLRLVRKNGIKADKACSVRLRQKGGIPLITVYEEHERDLAAFLMGFNAYRYFKG